jgi:hypothetical protein
LTQSVANFLNQLVHLGSSQSAKRRFSYFRINRGRTSVTKPMQLKYPAVTGVYGVGTIAVPSIFEAQCAFVDSGS